MSFWDSSALLPLCVNEPASRLVQDISRAHDVPVFWWASIVECSSALERRSRSGELTFEEKRHAEQLLWELAAAWSEVQPSQALRQRAVRLLRQHDLRAADALQVAAALLWAGERPFGRVFVCLDSRLRQAAQREGFTVLPQDWV